PREIGPRGGTMEANDLLTALFTLQKLNSLKTDLAIQVAEIYARQRDSEQELDLRRGLHAIGGARARFNELGMLEFMSEQRQRDEKVKNDYRDICQQIKDLEEQI